MISRLGRLSPHRDGIVTSYSGTTLSVRDIMVTGGHSKGPVMPSEQHALGRQFTVAGSFSAQVQAEQACDFFAAEGIAATALPVADHLGRAANSAPRARAVFWPTLLFSTAGAAMGLVLGLAWVAWFDGLMTPGWRLLIAAALAAVAGGAIGFLTRGLDAGIQLVEHHSDPTAARGIVVVIHTDRRDIAEHAAEVLAGFGAQQVEGV